MNSLDILIKDGLRYQLAARNVSISAIIKLNFLDHLPSVIGQLVMQYMWASGGLIAPDIVDAIWPRVFVASAGYSTLAMHIMHSDGRLLSSPVPWISFLFTDRLHTRQSGSFPINKLFHLITAEKHAKLSQKLATFWKEAQPATIENLFHDICTQLQHAMDK